MCGYHVTVALFHCNSLITQTLLKGKQIKAIESLEVSKKTFDEVKFSGMSHLAIRETIIYLENVVN